jgi:hypothetical protein
MNERLVAAVAALTTIVLGAARVGGEVARSRAVETLLTGAPAPTVGTTGQTVTLYLSLFDVVAPLATVAVTLGLGVYLGRRVDVRTDHRDLLRAVGAGSGAVAAVAGVAAFVASGPLSVYGVLFGAVTAFRVFATLTLPLLVGTLAGAALVAFERGGDGTEPTRADAEASAEGSDGTPAADRSADHAGAD